ncbi:glycyl aminopeptidase [Haladaptatus sp. NG-WS-4]
MALRGRVSGGTVSLLLVLSLVGGVLAPPATAQSADAPPGVSISVERSADDRTTVRYRLSFETPQETRSFWLINYTGNVVSSEGFVTDQTKSGDHALRWDGETESPSVTVVADGDAGNGREYAATDEWALVPTPKLSVAWSPRGSDEWRYRHPLQDDYPESSVEFADTGVLGSAFTYVGPYEEHTHRADGQRFRMVVGAGATPASSPEKVFKSLGTASQQLPGQSPDEVLFFVLPDPIWRGGYASPTHDEFWVHEDASLADPQNLWIHEYVHTRQSFELADRMTWFREASAAYFAADLTIRQGRTSQSAVAETLSAKRYDDAVLSKANTWTNPEVPYYRGALVLWALDAKIQQATDGKRSLLDVFDRMNRHDGPVTYADFESIVPDVAGQSMDSWLSRHVTTTAKPDVQGLEGGIGEGSSDSGGADSSSEKKVSGKGGQGQSGGSDSTPPLAMTGDLPSTLVLWGGLSLIGLVFGLTVAQYVSGLVARFRGER